MVLRKGAFPKLPRVTAPYGHFLAKRAVWINLFYCEVISFDNVAYVVTHWHIIKTSFNYPGLYLPKVKFMRSALRNSTYSTWNCKFHYYYNTSAVTGYYFVYVIPLMLDYTPEWSSRGWVLAGGSKLPLLSYHLMSMTQCYMCVPDKNEEKCILCDVAAFCKIVCVWLFWK